MAAKYRNTVASNEENIVSELDETSTYDESTISKVEAWKLLHRDVTYLLGKPEYSDVQIRDEDHWRLFLAGEIDELLRRLLPRLRSNGDRMAVLQQAKKCFTRTFFLKLDAYTWNILKTPVLHCIAEVELANVESDEHNHVQVSSQAEVEPMVLEIPNAESENSVQESEQPETMLLETQIPADEVKTEVSTDGALQRHLSLKETEWLGSLWRWGDTSLACLLEELIRGNYARRPNERDALNSKCNLVWNVGHCWLGWLIHRLSEMNAIYPNDVETTVAATTAAFFRKRHLTMMLTARQVKKAINNCEESGLLKRNLQAIVAAVAAKEQEA
jgi:hypothetical protein